jgi:hypothetical protein
MPALLKQVSEPIPTLTVVGPFPCVGDEGLPILLKNAGGELSGVVQRLTGSRGAFELHWDPPEILHVRPKIYGREPGHVISCVCLPFSPFACQA